MTNLHTRGAENALKRLNQSSSVSQNVHNLTVSIGIAQNSSSLVFNTSNTVPFPAQDLLLHYKGFSLLYTAVVLYNNILRPTSSLGTSVSQNPSGFLGRRLFSRKFTIGARSLYSPIRRTMLLYIITFY